MLAGVKSMGHITPAVLTAKMNANIREDKLHEKEICKELYAQAKHADPGATENRLTAIVFKRLQDIKKGRTKSGIEPTFNFMPDLSASKASKPPAPFKAARRTFASSGSRALKSRHSQSETIISGNRSNKSKPTTIIS